MLGNDKYKKRKMNIAARCEFDNSDLVEVSPGNPSSLVPRGNKFCKVYNLQATSKEADLYRYEWPRGNEAYLESEQS